MMSNTVCLKTSWRKASISNFEFNSKGTQWIGGIDGFGANAKWCNFLGCASPKLQRNISAFPSPVALSGPSISSKSSFLLLHVFVAHHSLAWQVSEIEKILSSKASRVSEPVWQTRDTSKLNLKLNEAQPLQNSSATCAELPGIPNLEW